MNQQFLENDLVFNIGYACIEGSLKKIMTFLIPGVKLVVKTFRLNHSAAWSSWNHWKKPGSAPVQSGSGPAWLSSLRQAEGFRPWGSSQSRSFPSLAQEQGWPASPVQFSSELFSLQNYLTQDWEPFSQLQGLRGLHWWVFRCLVSER